MMRYEGPIYRPPSEAESLLIQATVGCPHNKCTFCMVYKKGPPYRVRPVKEICEDIKEACNRYGKNVSSFFCRHTMKKTWRGFSSPSKPKLGEKAG